MDSIPYSEVRARLAETLKQLEVREEPILISRRGQPAGVLMSVAQYQRLRGATGGLAEALTAWRARYADELAADEAAGDGIDPYADVRDRSIDGGRPSIDFNALLGDEPPGDGSAAASAAASGAASAVRADPASGPGQRP